MEDPQSDSISDGISTLEVPLLQDDNNQNEEAISATENPCNDDSIDESSDDSPFNHHETSSSVRGRLFLLTVAFLYGSLNVSLRLLYALHGPPSPSILSMTRGWMSSFCFLPLLFCKNKKRDSETISEEEDDDSSAPQKSIWRPALELSILTFTSQALFFSALKITASARASFLGQTTVIMVPLIASVLGEKIHWKVWLGCAASTTGLIILSQDGENSTKSGFGLGDILVLGGTVLWSMYVIRISQVARSYDEVSLQCAKNFLTSVQYTLWVIVGWVDSNSVAWTGWNSPVAWLILSYSAIGPGCMADLLQQKGQEMINASESNLILAMEPVFTTVLGRVILGEETSWLEKLGGACLILGALVAGQ